MCPVLKIAYIARVILYLALANDNCSVDIIVSECILDARIQIQCLPGRTRENMDFPLY